MSPPTLPRPETFVISNQYADRPLQRVSLVIALALAGFAPCPSRAHG
jgi:hypothetical protein